MRIESLFDSSGGTLFGSYIFEGFFMLLVVCLLIRNLKGRSRRGEEKELGIILTG